MPSPRRPGDENPSKVQPLSVREFFKRFPDDAACLEHVMSVRYGLRHPCDKCLNVSTFHRLAERRAYSCAACGHHVYPCAGTIFEDSRTPLQIWFYATYLFIATRHGVSGKELQRTLGVTYKTAWRIGQKVRELMAKAEGFEVLKGHVEVDEAYVGGRRPGRPGRGAAGKTVVVGMKERDGKVRDQTVPDASKKSLRGVVTENVEPGSIVSTDEWVSYGLLRGDGYEHGVVRHGAKEYLRIDWRLKVAHHTNGVESFWNLFKNSVRSTHIHVSPQHMDKYLSEFAFRSNHREMKNAMFDLLIGAV